MTRKYFGTDGIRGRTNTVPLTPEIAHEGGHGGRAASSPAASIATAW